MHKDELRRIAAAKIHDAQLLFSQRRYSNSYYLFGYGIEIGIKARIARTFAGETIPDKKFVLDIYTHDLDKLINLAGLKPNLERERKASTEFDGYWSTVSEWSEQSRYAMIDMFQATAMQIAVQDPDQGVFKWLETNW